MAEALPTFPTFDPNADLGAPGVRFKKYIARFRNLIVAADIENPNRQKALLLHYAGEEVNDIFETLTIAAPGESETVLDTSIKALSEYFTPKQNTVYEEYQFRNTKQTRGEPLMTFHTRLKQLSLTCEFADADREIKSQIVQHGRSQRLRRKALADPHMTLAKLLELGRAMELADTQAKNLEQQDDEKQVNRFTTGNRRHGNVNNKPRDKPRNYSRSKPNPSTNSKCRNCGGSYPHKGGKTACPAHGKECRSCGKLHHFQSVCLQGTRPNKQTSEHKKPDNHQQRGRRDLRMLGDNESTDDSDEYELFTIEISVNNVKSDRAKQPMFDVNIAGTPLTIMADSGSSINILDEQDYRKLTKQPSLEKTRVKVYPYQSDTPLPVLGKFTAPITSTRSTRNEIFHVVKGTSGSLLSWQTSMELDLLQVVQPIKAQEVPTVDQLTNKYQDLFNGLGKLKNFQVKLHIDETVPPVAQPHRRVPFHVRKQLEEQLKRDEDLGVIERIEGPTPWVSPIVVAPKPKSPGKIRVCVDMRQANEAVERERHITPTIKEIVGDLNGATVFSKLDLNQGYNQLELAPESRYITTFSTHLGLMRYKRLNFGISSAAEVFQNAIRETLGGIEGAINISDDILIYGKTQEQHNRTLEAVFQRLRDSGLTLNERKCKYNKDKLEFLGYVFGAAGMSPDPNKVDDIINLDAPTSATEVRSLLGMTNYCSRFIKDYATVTQPLRELTHKNHPWEWTTKHGKALTHLKHALANAPVTAYFDPDKDTELTVDASPVGLGAILAQVDPATGDKHIIVYASRSLTSVEQRYSQTEREALAVVWACEHFHLYIYGKPVNIYTDHKPLETIYGSSKSKPPARIERWALRLQPYQATVRYRKGEDNPADYMSRHPARHTQPVSRQEKVAEEYVNYIAATSAPKALTLSQIAEATARDPTLQAVMEAVRTNKWHTKSKHPKVDSSTYNNYEHVKGELTIGTTIQIILRGTKLVIPTELQKRVVDLAHEGHQGITKTKALLREKVWFPGINQIVEERVKSCLACQAATPETKREPLQMSPLPDKAWQEVSIDFAELSTGDYLLVISDDYSRYPVVEILRSLTARTVIPKLDKVFSEFGIPEIVKSDNGPPFNSNAFETFANDLGFIHRKITPLWPRANGEVERFMRTVKKIVKIALTEQKPWREELSTFLRNYRATPHSTTGKAPATALFNRPVRIKLPEVQTTPHDQADIKWKDAQAKGKMKEYADRKAYVKPSNIRPGDTVLVKRDRSYKKSQTPYEPQPYIVTSCKGSMVTARHGDRTVTRNSSFFKPVQLEDIPHMDEFTDYSDDEEDEPANHNEGQPLQPQLLPMPRRYPRRDRNPPAHLKDYVPT